MKSAVSFLIPVALAGGPTFMPRMNAPVGAATSLTSSIFDRSAAYSSISLGGTEPTPSAMTDKLVELLLLKLRRISLPT
ncbi:Uncharacterised protein [Mycobacteroides abscessus]|nr:Uncharacterised protein [Mycobacteroides abscessus]